MATTRIDLDISDKGALKGLNAEAKGIADSLQRAANSSKNIPKIIAASKQAPNNQVDNSRDSSVARSLGPGTGSDSRDFAKQAQGLGGLVHVYATFAANIFALSAGFTALSRAADTSNMIKGLDQLGASSGRSLGGLSKQLSLVTDGAISLRDAMTATAQASAGGMTNDAILRMGVIAKNASQALGIAMPDALSRLTRGIVKLEPELLDEIGIMVRVDKASQDYARTLGKSAGALTDFEKRQGFANAVMEQGEKKFNSINIDSNPYAKILASMENLAQTGLELVNKTLTPLLNLLSTSPTALAAGMAVMASILLKQAIPALGAYRSNLKATEEAQRSRLLNIARDNAERVKADDELVAQSLAKQFKMTEANVREINKISKSRLNSDIIGKDVRELMKKSALDLTADEIASAKTRRDQLLASDDELYKKQGQALKNQLTRIENMRQRSATFVSEGQQDHIKEVDKLWSHSRQQEMIYTRESQNFVKSRIKALVAETAAVDGPRKAWTVLNQEIAKSKNSEQIVNEDQVKRTGAFANGMLRVGGAVSIATSAVTTALNAFSRFIGYIGIALVAFQLLDSWLTTSAKEEENFANSVDQATASVKSAYMTLDALTAKTAEYAYSIDVVQARANAFSEITASIQKQAKAFDKLTQAQSGWGKFWDGAWDLIGKGSIDKLGDSLGDSVVAALAIMEDGPAKQKAKEAFQNILGGDVDITKASKISDAIDSMTKPEAIAKAHALGKAFNSINNEIGNAASSLTAFGNSLTEISKEVQNQLATLKPSDAFGKIGSKMVQSSYDLGVALKDPLHKLAAIQKLSENKEVLGLLPVETVRQLKDSNKELAILAERLKSAKDIRDKAAKDAEAGGKNRGKNLIIKEQMEEKVSIATENLQKELSKLQGIEDTLFTKGIDKLGHSLENAIAEGGRTAAKGLLSVLKDAGGNTASLEGKLQQDEFAAQISLIESNFSLSKNIQIQSLETEKLTLAMEMSNALIRSNSGSENVRAGSFERIAELTKRQEVVNKKSVILGNDKEALKAFKGDRTESGIQAGKELAGYAAELFGKLAQIVKIQGAAAAAKIQTEANVMKESANSSKRDIDSNISIASADLKLLDTEQQLLGIYNEETSAKRNKLELYIQEQNYIKQLIDLSTKRNIAELVQSKIKNTSSKEYKEAEIAVAKAQQEVMDLVNSNLVAQAVTKSEQLKKDLAGIESLRQAQATRFTEQLNFSLNMQTALNDQNRSELQYAMDMGEINNASAIRASNALDLEQQRISYVREKNSIEQKGITDIIALENAKKVALEANKNADLTGINIAITRAKEGNAEQLAGLTRINEVKVTGINLSSQAKLAIDAENESLKKQNEIMNNIKDMAKSLTTVFGEIGTAIGDAVIAMQEGAEAQLKIQKDLEKDKKKVENDDSVKDKLSAITELEQKAAKDSEKTQLSTIGNIAGASKKLFKEKTVAYKLLDGIEKASHIMKIAMQLKEMMGDSALTAQKIFGNSAVATSAVAASAAETAAATPVIAANAMKSITNQGSGDPYTAFARIAAMIAIMAAITGGISSSSVSIPSGFSAEDQQKVQGTGQSYKNGELVNNGGGALGDSTAKSKSIENSIALIEEHTFDQLSFSHGKTYAALIAIRDNTEQFVKALVTTTGITGGLSAFGTKEGANSGFLGFNSESTTVEDTGIIIKGVLKDLINGAGTSQQYENVSSKESSFWGLFSSESNTTNTTALTASVQKYISGIFTGFKDSLVSVAETLGSDINSVSNLLDGFQIDIKTSGKGLTGAEFAEAVMAEIGIQLDIAAKMAFPALESLSTEFQKLGESLSEFAIRLANDAKVVPLALSQVGLAMKKLPETASRATKEMYDSVTLAEKKVADAKIKVSDQTSVRAVYSSGAGDGGEGYWSTLASSIDPKAVQALADAEKELAIARGNVTAANSGATSNNIHAVETLIKLSGGLETFLSDLESYGQNYLTDAERLVPVQKAVYTEMDRLGFAAVRTKAEFKKLVESLDLTKTADQELYVSLMKVQDGFATVTDALDATVAGIQELIDNIHLSVTSSIFDMKYGMQDNPGKYGMLDTKGAELESKMLASTDIATIAKLAEDQISVINQAWDLLSSDQKANSFGEYEAKLNKIDAYVTEKGADAISVEKAKNQELANTIATAVKDAMTDSSDAIMKAAGVILEAAGLPAVAEIAVNVTKAPGTEVSVSGNY